MEFSKWLAEWEGNSFSQEDDLVNNPFYPNSKYKGKGIRQVSPDFSGPGRLYGFRPNDELLKRRMKKK